MLQLLPCIHSGTVTPAMFNRLPTEQARIDRQAATLIETWERFDQVIDEARDRLPVAI